MAVGRPLRGRRRQDLENQSITTSTHVLPSETGRSVMKSTPRCDQGRLGTGSRRSLPNGKWRGLLRWRSQNSAGRTFSHPWPYWATRSDPTAARGCCWPLGGQCPEKCEWNESSECVVLWEHTVINILRNILRSSEMMGSGSSWISSGAWSRERASALTFLGPGR